MPTPLMQRILRDFFDAGPEQAAGDVVSEVEQEPGALNPGIIEEAYRGFQQAGPSLKSEAARKSVGYVQKSQSEVRKGLARVEGMPKEIRAEEGITPERLKSLRAGAKEPVETGSLLRSIGAVLDAPDRYLIREPLSWAAGEKAGGESSEKFHAGMRRAAARGSAVGQLVGTLKKPVEESVGLAGGALNVLDEVLLPGAISGAAKAAGRQAAVGAIPGIGPALQAALPLLETPALAASAKETKPSREVTAKGLSETFQKGKEATGDLAWDLIVSPLNLLGAKTGAEASKAVAARLLKEAGHRGPQLAQAVEAASNLLGSEFTPATFGKLESLLGQFGVASGRVKQAFGELGEFLNRGQFAVAGRSLEPEWGLQKKAIAAPARAVGAMQDIVFGGEPTRPLYQHLQESRFLKLNEQATRAAKEMESGRLRAAVRPMQARSAGIDAERAKEVAAPVINPAAGTGPMGPLTPQEHQYQQELGAWIKAQEQQLARAGLQLPTPERDVSPEEFLDAFINSAASSRALQGSRRRLEGFLSQPGGSVLTRGRVESSLARSFDQLTDVAGDRWIRELIQKAPMKPLRWMLDKTVDVLQHSQTWWKNNVTVRVPRYHIINAANDIMQMTYAGMKNPGRWLLDAARVLRGDRTFTMRVGGQVYDGAALQKMAKDLDIGLGASSRLDLALAAGGKTPIGAAKLQEVAGRGPKAGVGQRIWEAATGRIADRAGDKLPINAAFGEKWERTAKTALFLHELSRGAAPQLAAETSFKFLLDYADKGKVLQVARWFVPFSNWLSKAPRMAAYALGRSPASVQFWHKVSQSMGVEGAQNEEPLYRMQSEGETIPLSPTGAVAGAREALGAPPTPEGWELRASPRTVFSEAIAFPAALAERGFGAAAESAGPWWKMAYGLKTGKDITTDADVSPSQAIMQAVSPMVASQPWLIGANRALSEAMGPGAPARPLGFAPWYMTPGEATAQDILSALGLRTFEVGPHQRALNVEKQFLEPMESAAKKLDTERKRKSKRGEYE